MVADAQRAARRAAGLKQDELAHRAGLSRMTVQRIEAGTIDPRVSTVLGTARAAGYGPPGLTGEAPVAVIAHGGAARPPGPGFHLALVAASREAVHRFHAAALAVGGVDEGAPGTREHYDPGYYAAFVRDPDGHRLEVVLHEQVASS